MSRERKVRGDLCTILASREENIHFSIICWLQIAAAFQQILYNQEKQHNVKGSVEKTPQLMVFKKNNTIHSFKRNIS